MHCCVADEQNTCPQVPTPVQCTLQVSALQVTELPQELTPLQETVQDFPAHLMAPMQLCRPQRMSHEEASVQSTPAAHVFDPHITRQGMPFGQTGMQIVPSPH